MRLYLQSKSDRLVQNADSLLFLVQKGRFFKISNFMEAKVPLNSSFTWRGMAESMWIIRVGTHWQIGNGKTVCNWEDNWIPRGSNFRVVSSDDEEIP